MKKRKRKTAELFARFEREWNWWQSPEGIRRSEELAAVKRDAVRSVSKRWREAVREICGDYTNPLWFWQ